MGGTKPVGLPNSATSASFNWLMCGFMTTNDGLEATLGDSSSGTTQNQLSSQHPKVVNFCMGDYAAKSCSVEIDYDVFQALGGLADGKMASIPE